MYSFLGILAVHAAHVPCTAAAVRLTAILSVTCEVTPRPRVVRHDGLTWVTRPGEPREVRFSAHAAGHA